MFTDGHVLHSDEHLQSLNENRSWFIPGNPLLVSSRFLLQNKNRHLEQSAERKRRHETGQPELVSIGEERWESSWVPLGLNHMCWWGGGGPGGRRELRGQRGGSAESDGTRPCEALLALSSAPLSAHNPPPYLTPAPCLWATPGQSSVKLLGRGRRDRTTQT